tara:strand:- start:201 stop:437 length:237 start_codon:yes stop_codon:yes gene_type:complete
MPIAIGAKIDPRKIPNLNQILFNGNNKFELIKPKNKNINEIEIDQILKDSSFNKGHKEIMRKTTKKVIPKLLFELILI